MKVIQSCLTLFDPMDCPWNSPGQHTGVGSLSLLQGIFLTQESNRGLLYCRWILYQLSYQGSRADWYRWTYLQSRNRDRDVENKHRDTKGEKEEWDELGDWDWRIYTAMYKEITNENLLYSTGNSLSLGSWQISILFLFWRNSKKRRYMCTYSWFTLLYSRK